MAGQNKIILAPDLEKIPGRNKAEGKNQCTMNGPIKKQFSTTQNEATDRKHKNKRLRVKEVSNMDTVLQQLYFLESKLRKEQKEIWNILAQRDHTILLQRQEIEKLRRENKKMSSRTRKSPEMKPENLETDKTKNKSAKESVLTICGSELPKHSYNLYDTKDSKKVCHKPPIAEKPKLNPSGYIVTTCALKSNKPSHKGCNIATTISQLLNEESDHGIVVSSDSSEPSSPESTLKTLTPKVVKTGRSQEKAVYSEKNKVKPFIMDDYEVTSGYNSDTVSEQEHDYENIELKNSRRSSLKNKQTTGRLHSSKPATSCQQDKFSSNCPIYSNVEYAEERLRDGSDVIEALNLQIGSVSSLPINNSTSKRKNHKSQEVDRSQHKQASNSNVPRNRSNINQLMEAEDKHVIMQNFEEFSLDSLDLDSYEQKYIFGKENSPIELTRHSGDGAESKNSHNNSEIKSSVTNGTSGGYEKFLEATGLSQKSILTPSRMLCNHRSMLKPRDIKHRNKLRVYFTGLPTLEEGSISQSGSPSRKNDKKYWREPFL